MTVEPCQPALGGLDRAGGVGFAQQFLGQIRGADLTGRVTGPQAVLDAFPTSLAEPFMSDEQQAPDPIQGSPLRPLCPRVSCWTRRQTSSRAALAKRMAWK